MQVVNIAGRVIRRVCTATVQSAGANTVLWDGWNNSGTKAPRGRYLVKVTARGVDGQQTQGIAPLSVGR